jgi:RNA polymerase sigma-70 factor (sigma-E family)
MADVGVSPWSEGFDDLYRERRQPMVRLAFLILGGDSAAEEVVQDAFLRVQPRLHDLDDPAAYLRRTVVNACLSHGRRRGRERVALRRSAPIDTVVTGEADELRDALRGLPLRQRTVVVLRYYGDLPEATIAATLGTTVPAVKSLLHRALQDLREVIDR